MNDLKFGEKIVAKDVSRFVSASGFTREAIPRIVREGRELMDTRDLAYWRLNAPNEQDRAMLRNGYIVVGDAAIKDPEGSEVVIVRSNANETAKKIITGINDDEYPAEGVRDCRFNNDWSLRISKDEYEAIKEEGSVLTYAARELDEMLMASPRNAFRFRTNIWTYLLGGDSELVLDYMRLLDEEGANVDTNSSPNRVKAYLGIDVDKLGMFKGLKGLKLAQIGSASSGSMATFFENGGILCHVVGMYEEANGTLSSRQPAPGTIEERVV